MRYCLYYIFLLLLVYEEPAYASIQYQITTVKAYYDSSSFHIGGYVNVNTGKIESRHNYKRTDFISVEADDVVEISSPISLMAGIAFFDKNKRFISGAYQQKNGLLMEKAPHNAAFVIASRRIDYDYDPYLKIYATCNMHQSTEGKILEIERSLNSLEPTCFAIPVIFRPAIGRKDLESMGIDASKSNIRIPVHTVTNNGVILVVCDGNNNGGPSHKCLLAISSDNGLTWKHKILNISAGNNGILYDKKNGVVFIFGGRQFIKSYDDGKNWSSPVEMKISRVDGYDRIYGSPTTGIQLSNGILAMPYRALSVDKNNKVKESVNFVMYSKDGGNTWKQSPATNRGIMADEVTIAEYSPNQIMIN